MKILKRFTFGQGGEGFRKVNRRFTFFIYIFLKPSLSYYCPPAYTQYTPLLQCSAPAHSSLCIQCPPHCPVKPSSPPRPLLSVTLRARLIIGSFIPGLQHSPTQSPFCSACPRPSRSSCKCSFKNPAYMQHLALFYVCDSELPIKQASFDHVKVGPMPVLALHNL